MGELMRNKISGFGLIELMVALVISLLFISGLYSLFSGNQKAISLMRVNGQIVLDGDKSMNIINSYIQYAGYRDYTQIKNQQYLPAASAAGVTWNAKQFIYGDNQVTGSASVKNNTDDIFIRYWGSGSTTDDTILNCHGAGVANTAINTVHIFVDSSNNLNCFDVINNDNTVIASGIENLQIRYVLKNGTSMTYKEPPLSVSEYESVVRIEIALVMAANFDNNLSGASNYTIWGTSYAVATDDSHRLRHVYTNSILVRN
nr:PilW family protein [uncultured Tolumonas sp.]